jgi:ribonucleoside-diphosphate reductase alpha chain
MSNGTKVVKRNGATEILELNKLHVMVEEACKDLAGVSASQVEMQSGIQFYDGITTAEIQEILIRSASDLIDLDHPNYQFVAARLLLFAIRKQIFGRMHEAPTVKQHVDECIKKGVYDAEIADLYSDEEFEKLESLLIIVVTIYSLMRVYVRSLISTSCKIEVLVPYMKHHSLCTF